VVIFFNSRNNVRPEDLPAFGVSYLGLKGLKYDTRIRRHCQDRFPFPALGKPPADV